METGSPEIEEPNAPASTLSQITTAAHAEQTCTVRQDQAQPGEQGLLQYAGMEESKDAQAHHAAIL